MKNSKLFTLIFIYIFIIDYNIIYSQIEKLDGGAYLISTNDTQNPCITTNDYALLDIEVQNNIQKLGLNSLSN